MSEQFALLVTAKFEDEEDRLYVITNTFTDNNPYIIKDEGELKVIKEPLPLKNEMWFMNNVLYSPAFITFQPQTYKEKNQEEKYRILVDKSPKGCVGNLTSASLSICIVNEEEIENHISQFIQKYIPSYKKMYDYNHFMSNDNKVHLFIDSINKKGIVFGKDDYSYYNKYCLMKEFEVDNDYTNSENIEYNIELLKSKMSGESKRIGNVLGSDIINKILTI